MDDKNISKIEKKEKSGVNENLNKTSENSSEKSSDTEILADKKFIIDSPDPDDFDEGDYEDVEDGSIDSK